MPTSLVADGVLAGGLAIYAELLHRLRRVDAPTPPWWFGYARDGTNLSFVLIAWGAFLGLDFPPAVAFLAAALTTLTTYVLDWALARSLTERAARIALGVALAGWVACVALRPDAIGRALERLIAAVQPVTVP
ncbi:MAG: hypothetical protein JWM53_5424 [bacterium]|nr:hypothetical protein [bacterium]